MVTKHLITWTATKENRYHYHFAKRAAQKCSFTNRQIEFDLDDGVSVNYAKFEGAVAKI